MQRFLLALTTCLCLSSSAYSQSTSELNKLGSIFVESVNQPRGSQRDSLLRLLHTSEKVASNLGKINDAFDRYHATYAPLALHHCERTGKYLHLFAMSEKDEQWRDFQFLLSETSPIRMEHLVFIAEVTEPVYLPNGSIDQEPTLQWLRQYIATLVSENDLSAAILIAKGSQIIFEQNVGFADAKKQRPIGPTTQFCLASGNKMFTALSVMKLRDQKKLSLSDPLIRYFPDYPDKSFAEAATAGQLISHTSGLGDFFGESYFDAMDTIVQLNHMLPFVLDDSIAFKPGTQFQYSNSGFILAGLVIEQVSGQNYYDYVRDQIYRPSGMIHSNTDAWHDSMTIRAIPLKRDGSGWTPSPIGKRGSSAGGGFSTTREILLFSRALAEGKIVSPATLKEMTTPKNLGMEDRFPYGYGFELAISNNRLVSYGHGGIADGVNFEFRCFPADDLTLVIFSNQNNGAYDDLKKNTIKLITGDR